MTDPVYIYVDIKNGGLTKGEAGSIVVYTRRVNSTYWPENINDHPTAFCVEGQFDGTTEWKQLFNVYFVYRGSYTNEYSSRIPISDIWTKSGMTGVLRKLRFTVLATNGNKASDSKNIAIAMNCFDVLKIGQNENYSDTFKDRFHLNTDYRTHLRDYTFRHTQGIFDDVNRVEGWDKISDAEKNELKSTYGIDIPEFELISNSSTKNKPICTLAPGQSLQPTHEVEHILYAMPGDVINLYPYYELYHTDQFYENFSHWYDYKTGGRLKYPDVSTTGWTNDFDMLDFLTDPEKIQISDREGFFAGFGMAGINDFSETTYTVNNVNDYINAVKDINEHQKFSFINITASELDFNNRNDIPMLGDGYEFQGIINGNGTTIKNLKYQKSEKDRVGLIGTAGGTVVVKNLILDKSCTFIGNKQIGGIVGYLNSGSISISDIRTEATLYSSANISDQNAGGILGYSSGTCNGFKISDCYIGGKIGDNNNATAFNAAVIAGWWGAVNNSSLTNIVVDCNLIGPDNSGNGLRYYVRHGGSKQEVSVSESGIKSRGGISFVNCYGDLQPDDECWKPFRTTATLPSDANTTLTGWNLTTMTPPMNTASPNYTYKVGNVTEYINAVNAINGGQYSANIELTADINFNGQAGIPMIGAYDAYGNTAFKGHFNGRGFTIRGLKIDTPTENMVGMFSCVGDGAVIENLIIDESCEFVGKSYVGIIGRMYSGGLTVRNVKSKANIIAKEYDWWVTSAGGILGIAANGGTNNYVNMTDVYVGGKVIGKTSTSALVGYLACDNTTTQSNFTNVVVECEIENPASSGRRYAYFSNPNMAKFTNCYGNGIDDADTRVTPYVATKKQYIAEWKDAQTPAMTGKINSGYELAEGDKSKRLEEHRPGTVATFFCPKNPYEGLYQSLPFSTGEKEYIIAADFSKTFDLNKHLDIDGGVLSEPIIAFRHIFRIRDGKEFADQNFGSYTGNREYVRRNQKFVSARCNVPFQIRLTTPVPVKAGPTVPTNIYYKKSADEYGRVSGKMEIILLDGDTRKEINRGEPGYTEFYFGDEFDGVGERTINGEKYSIGDGTNKFYRMLKCNPNGQEGHYIVQLVATENPDDPSKRIKVYGATDETDSYLIVAEYNIRFLPKKGATMLTMDALYDNDEYAFARVETLEERFSTPVDVINFDEYININILENLTLRNKLISLNETKDIYGNEIAPNSNSKYKLKNPNLYHTFFKWPIPWDKANYAYGYDYTDGYNMYMLATHSDMVHYRQAVSLRDYYTYGGSGNIKDYTDKNELKLKDPNPILGNKNADNHGRGLYDVKYYRTKRKIDEYYKSQQKKVNEPSARAGEEANSDMPELEQGYFYWGNAASDPGVATRLEINDLCPGSTIHVSAWISEFSIDEESTNLSFNFVAVMKKDNDAMGVKAGDRVVLHSFITGYVPDGGKFYRNRTWKDDGSPYLDSNGNQYGQTHWVFNPNYGNPYYDVNQLNPQSYRNNGQTTTTGTDDDMRGQWLNVYYSFVPRIAEFGFEGITSDDVYYELELDNNAKSSKGADFGIDDIRIYLEPPMVDVTQLKPACDNESTRLKMVSPFETLLEIVGQPETLSTDGGESLAAYYTFINKPNFDRLYKLYKEANDPDAGSKAYAESVVRFNYNTGSVTDERNYGKVVFNSNYNKNEEYKFNSEATPSGIAFRNTDKESGERFIVFESDVAPGKFDVGAEYYIVLKAALSNIASGVDNPDNDPWEFFDMMGDCANKNVISIRSSQVIKLDGVFEPNSSNLKVCENQSPVLQVNMWGTNDDTGDMVEVEKNAHLDWFYGLIKDSSTGKGFEDINETHIDKENGNPDHTLKDALSTFRQRYPKAESVAGIDADPDTYKGEYKIEEWMLKLIDWACTPSEENPVALLTLYQSSYVMPPLELEEREDAKDNYVVAIPIVSVLELTNYIVCSSPAQLKVTVGNKSPKLKHGLSYLPYPDELVDVPLRLGLDQLRTENGANADKEFTMKTITIPVRHASSSDNKVNSLNRIPEKVKVEDEVIEKEGCILLVQTNDPEYKDLGTLTAGEENEQLLWVGEITTLTANTGEGSNIEDNKFKVKFYDDIHFKEGYFYRMRFQFQENVTADDNEEADAPVICVGQDVFTIKIVPKYQVWTGKENLNWNNDANWRRADKEDLYLSGSRHAELAHYITNGMRNNYVVNERKGSYAPLDFTYVLIDDEAESPYMYAPTLTEKGPISGTEIYEWPATPSVKDAGKSYSDYPVDGVGSVTGLIQYDMAAFYPDKTDLLKVGCRPWYANTCNEIHFKSGGTIMNQQELTYNKAWVDVELDHSRWQTVSTPLQEVYAGDFYLPSDGARQSTELYQDINFDNELKTNHRFKPAVFQRGWDKSVARVYEIDGPAVDATDIRNVAVKTFWSHVYNDVKEQYGGGVGFSIKTDISAMTFHKPEEDGKVLFRLPKADTEYLYWNKDGSQSGHKTDIARGDGQYRLNNSNGTITVTSANDTRYFLVGNPFMTHMDIQEFLKKNENLLEPNYWIVTEKGQIAGSVSSAGVFTAIASDSSEESLAAEPTVIPPMQGFFVKSKTSATTLSLEYDESMMRRYDSSGKYLTSTTRAEETLTPLKISSYNYGEPSSAALLLTKRNADADNDVEAIDNRDLDVLSTVYTTKDGAALSINSCADIEGTEIGVIADDDTETVIRFEGVESVEGLYLLDKTDRSLTPLEEGMEVVVDGAAAGRFFLTYGIAYEGMLSGIEWSVEGGVLTVVDNAASGTLEVNVFDTVGRFVNREATNADVLEMHLEHGIYVVDIRTAKECKSIKVRI
ncbi:MAG: hypothetical protein K2L22_03505 [Muribaculaceae bacterium]|nr:hypothetical protein [Muribaculaceae bacterium]